MGSFVTHPWSNMVGGTVPNQIVTADNIEELPPGSVIRFADSDAVLIHLHDRLWYRREGCSYCYDIVDRWKSYLPGILCHHPGEVSTSVLQAWVVTIPLMQQTVLLTAIRGPDGLPKYGAVKMLLRWYRRCILLSAMDKAILGDPIEPNGGSFTGPSLSSRPDAYWESGMTEHVDEYLRTLDAIPHHFHLHLMHAVEILGYKHPDQRIRTWWQAVYCRLVNDMHLHPETEAELDARLGDSRAGWLERADPATTS